MACVCVESNRKTHKFIYRYNRYRKKPVSTSSKSAFNCNKRATSAASPASAARNIFVRPRSSRALMSACIAAVVIAIESVCAAQDCFVLFWPEKKTRAKRDEKENQTKTNVCLRARNNKTKTRTQNSTFCFGKLSCGGALWLKNVSSGAWALDWQAIVP